MFMKKNFTENEWSRRSTRATVRGVAVTYPPVPTYPHLLTHTHTTHTHTPVPTPTLAHTHTHAHTHTPAHTHRLASPPPPPTHTIPTWVHGAYNPYCHPRIQWAFEETRVMIGEKRN
jgi:hypothetical protein